MGSASFRQDVERSFCCCVLFMELSCNQLFRVLANSRCISEADITSSVLRGRTVGAEQDAAVLWEGSVSAQVCTPAFKNLGHDPFKFKVVSRPENNVTDYAMLLRLSKSQKRTKD